MREARSKVVMTHLVRKAWKGGEERKKRIGKERKGKGSKGRNARKRKDKQEAQEGQDVNSKTKDEKKECRLLACQAPFWQFLVPKIITCRP